MFFSRKKELKVTDIVFLSEQGFTQAIDKWLQENAGGCVASWFPGDLERLRQALPARSGNIFTAADKLAYSHGIHGPLLFAGHYPLRTAETELCEARGLTEMLVYSHLDMGLFTLFGGLRIKELMIKMGMSEDEPLTHTMISRSISNAQDKIAKANITDMRARSEAEWMESNMIAGL